MKIINKVFGYARVSKQAQSLNMQIDALQKYGVDEIYQEKISGKLTDRPKLKELLGKLRSGDTLVIWRLDRLGRTTLQLIELANEFREKGIHFVSLTENIDTTTPVGKMIFSVLCAFSEMENDIRAERIQSGLEAARARGRVGGRPSINESTINTALKMYFSNEFSVKEITEQTGMSKTTLYRYVNERKNKRGYDGEEIQGKDE